MVYLIGGPARTGKTTVRQKILQDYGIEGVSTDFLRTFMEISYPESGISYLGDPVKNMELGSLYMENFILSAGYNEKDFVIEGDMIDPKMMFSKGIKGMHTSCIFLGYSSQDHRERLRLIRTNENENDWTKNYSDEALEKKIMQFLEQSKIIESICVKEGIPYLDIQHLSKKDVYNQVISTLEIKK